MGSVDWGGLPDDLLRRIVEDHIKSVDDYIMFSCVCQSWYSVASACDKSKLRTSWSHDQMPWLMLTDGNDGEAEAGYGFTRRYRSYHLYRSEVEYDVSVLNVRDYVKGVDLERDAYVRSDEDEENDNGDRQRCVFNLSHGRNKCYNMTLPEVYGRACWGSRYGWIVTLGRDREMFMFNPLTRVTLPLPSQHTFPFPWKRSSGKTIRNKFIDSAVLLWLPRHQNYRHSSNDGNWLVVALHHDYNLVAIAKPGDPSWTPILRQSRRHRIFGITDVVYCSRLSSLLFVNMKGNVYISDPHDIERPPVLKLYKKGPRNLEGSPQRHHIKAYITEFGGDNVLVVTRYYLQSTVIRDKFDNLIGFKNDDGYDECHGHRTENFRVHKLNVVTKRLKELKDLDGVSLFLGNNATILVRSSDVGCQRNSIYFCDDFRMGYGWSKNGFGGHDTGVFKMNDKTIRPFYDGCKSSSTYCCPVWFCASL